MSAYDGLSQVIENACAITLLFQVALKLVTARVQVIFRGPELTSPFLCNHLSYKVIQVKYLAQGHTKLEQLIQESNSKPSNRKSDTLTVA